MGLTLYFSPHSAEGITPHFRDLFRTADIVLLEQDYKEDDDRNLNLLNELSQGNLLVVDVLKVTGPTGQIFPDFNIPLMSMIFQCGKKILLENSPYTSYEASVQATLGRQAFRNMPLGKACQLLAENLTKRATNLKKRDEALAYQLADIVSQNVSSNILVIRGQGHQPSLEHELAARSVSFTSVTSHKQMSLSIIDRLIQKIIAGEKPTRIELLRSMVEQLRTKSALLSRDSVNSMSELQCERYLKEHLNLT